MNPAAKPVPKPLQYLTSRLASTLHPPVVRQRIAILGSGWAGYALAKNLDPRRYERILVSPRSYFVFTPLLASTAVGTLEFRAVLEPVRRLGLDAFHQG
jgi:NADH dehydrogenase FAD-containing subunit